MMGLVVVCRFAASAGGVPTATMTSGPRCTSFRRQLIVGLGLVRIPIVDREVPVLDIAQIAEAGSQCVEQDSVGDRREIAQTRRLRLLLLKGGARSRRAAESPQTSN